MSYNKRPYTTRRSTDLIVVHCADTSRYMDIGADEINAWHTAKGWNGIGYHYVITRRAEVEDGRPVYALGAHVKDFNSTSVGICLVGGAAGKFDFTRHQMAALESLVDNLLQSYPTATVVGHRDLDSRKTCPGFDVDAWYYGSLT